MLRIRVDTAAVNYNHPTGPSMTLVRYGPAILNPARWDGSLWWSGDGRKAVSGGIYVSYGRDEEGSYSAAVAPSIRGRGRGSFSWSLSPRLSRSGSAAFYVAQVADPLAGSTHGTRYIFAGLERATLGMTARTDLALTPRMTLQVYAEAFLSTGDYEEFGALRTGGTFDFLRYGEEGSTISRDGDFYSVDADGPGPAAAITNYSDWFVNGEGTVGGRKGAASGRVRSPAPPT